MIPLSIRFNHALALGKLQKYSFTAVNWRQKGGTHSSPPCLGGVAAASPDAW